MKMGSAASEAVHPHAAGVDLMKMTHYDAGLRLCRRNYTFD